MSILPKITDDESHDKAKGIVLAFQVIAWIGAIITLVVALPNDMGWLWLPPYAVTIVAVMVSMAVDSKRTTYRFRRDLLRAAGIAD